VTHLVSVVGLTHRYGELDVLDDITFAVAPGGMTAVVGPTGCGKSTLLRILAGLIRQTAGNVSIPGGAAYMPQGDTLLPWRTALANATLGAELTGQDRSATARRASELFDRFGLAGFERAWPSELSGGMRQRVALLRTVIAGRATLLLDEPFAALDAITRTDLQGWLAELLSVESLTALLVTHDVDEALRLADQVLVMSPRPGRILTRFKVPLPRPRSAETITQPELATLKRRVIAVLADARR
jgi:putative hydroxymethylpyrimidine transport system ATP-binding protein